VLQLSGLAGVSRSRADASIQVGAGTLVQADDAVTINATATSESKLSTLGYGVGITYADSDAQASATVDGGATIRAGGSLDVEAVADNTVEAKALGVSGSGLLVAVATRYPVETIIASGAVVEAV
jgi:hypothetical protein